MLIAHTSDWHLGRSLHGADLSEAVDLFLEWFIDLVEERHVDAVLISGDVFDRALPPVDSLQRLSRALERLCACTRVILTPGNHDSATRLGFTSPMLREELTIVSQSVEIGKAIEVPAAEGAGALVYPLPYLEPDLVRADLGEDGKPAGRSHEAVLSAALRKIAADLRERREAGDQRPALAMVHAFLTGGTPSDSERDIQVGGVARVPTRIFDTLGGFIDEDGAVFHGLDYVAAGHLHRPQDVPGSTTRVRYSGSPVPYSFSEADTAKSVTLVHLSDTALTSTETVEVPVFRELGVLSGPMEELLSPAHEAAAKAWLSITVTDAHRPPEMVPRLRARFPHALLVQHLSARAQDTPAAPGERSGPRSVSATATDFFTQVGGKDLDEAEISLLDDALTALRVEARS